MPPFERMRALAMVVALATLVTLGVGCGSNGGSGEPACAPAVVWRGETYIGQPIQSFTPGGRLGVGVLPPCDDVGGPHAPEGVPEEEGTEVDVHRVPGVDPRDAVAIHDGNFDRRTVWTREDVVCKPAAGNRVRCTPRGG